MSWSLVAEDVRDGVEGLGPESLVEGVLADAFGDERFRRRRDRDARLEATEVAIEVRFLRRPFGVMTALRVARPTTAGVVLDVGAAESTQEERASSRRRFGSTSSSSATDPSHADGPMHALMESST